LVLTKFSTDLFWKFKKGRPRLRREEGVKVAADSKPKSPEPTPPDEPLGKPQIKPTGKIK